MNDSSSANRLPSLFGNDRRQIRREIAAGVTTFLTMAYIVVVNPAILSQAGIPTEDVFFATCVASAIATGVMALWARYPFALAPGMGPISQTAWARALSCSPCPMPRLAVSITSTQPCGLSPPRLSSIIPCESKAE